MTDHVEADQLTRRHGESFVTPLSVREYLLLCETTVRGWPFGGWALIDPQGSVCGYHWHHPLDPGWSTAAAAFAAFIPNPTQRNKLYTIRFRVQRDPDGGLLAPYLCGTPIAEFRGNTTHLHDERNDRLWRYRPLPHRP